MRRSCFSKSTRTIAGLLTALLFAIFAVPVSAQLAVDSQHRLSFGYDKAHEITLTATIEEVQSKTVPGSPAGLHLLVVGPQGVVDAHLGPYLSKETAASLRAGVLVQIVGAMERLHGSDYLLARQLIFSGRVVTVRSENGLLMRVAAPRTGRVSAEKNSQDELNGGAR